MQSTLALSLQGWEGPFYHLKDALRDLTVSWFYLPFRAASHVIPTTVSWARWSLFACTQGSARCCSPSSVPPGSWTLFHGHYIQGCHYHILPQPLLSLLVNSRIQLCITPAWPIQYHYQAVIPKTYQLPSWPECSKSIKKVDRQGGNREYC